MLLGAIYMFENTNYVISYHKFEMHKIEVI